MTSLTQPCCCACARVACTPGWVSRAALPKSVMQLCALCGCASEWSHDPTREPRAPKPPEMTVCPGRVLVVSAHIPQRPHDTWLAPPSRTSVSRAMG